MDAPVAGDEAVGVVNLVDNDADDQPQWHPWLAGLVVHAAWRGRGVGSALGRALCTEAQRLGFARLYFGTDAPGFYARLGAVEQLRLRRDFCYMRFELPRRLAPLAASDGEYDRSQSKILAVEHRSQCADRSPL